MASGHSNMGENISENSSSNSDEQPINKIFESDTKFETLQTDNEENKIYNLNTHPNDDFLNDNQQTTNNSIPNDNSQQNDSPVVIIESLRPMTILDPTLINLFNELTEYRFCNSDNNDLQNNENPVECKNDNETEYNDEIEYDDELIQILENSKRNTVVTINENKSNKEKQKRKNNNRESPRRDLEFENELERYYEEAKEKYKKFNEENVDKNLKLNDEDDEDSNISGNGKENCNNKNSDNHNVVEIEEDPVECEDESLKAKFVDKSNQTQKRKNSDNNLYIENLKQDDNYQRIKRSKPEKLSGTFDENEDN